MTSEEEWAGLLGRMQLSGVEEDEVRIEEGEVSDIMVSGKSCLLGKLLSDRGVSAEVLHQTLTPVWRLRRGVSIRVIENQIFLFRLDDEADRAKVWLNGPWTFDHHLIVFTQFEGRMQLSRLPFDKVAFWVRILGLPLVGRSAMVAQRIANKLGVFLDADIEGGGAEWGPYVRVRVLLDVTQPIPRAIKVRVVGDEPILVRLQYECLPRICYVCRCFAHRGRNCPVALKERARGGSAPFQYGPWMRVPQQRRSWNGDTRQNMADVDGGFSVSQGDERRSREMGANRVEEGAISLRGREGRKEGGLNLAWD